MRGPLEPADDLHGLPKAERRHVRLLLTIEALSEAHELAKRELERLPPSTEESPPVAPAGGAPPAEPARNTGLAAFAERASAALLHAEKFAADIRTLIDERRHTRLQGIPHPSPPGAFPPAQQPLRALGGPQEALHVFAASAFASLYEAAEKLIELICPADAVAAEGPPEAPRTTGAPRSGGPPACNKLRGGAAFSCVLESHRLRLLAGEAPRSAALGAAAAAVDTPNGGVFRRCFAAAVPMSGSLPSGAVCGIASHELLVLLQRLCSSHTSSSSTARHAELVLWALRCLYGIASCFCFVSSETSPEDAAAARDGALRLYPLIAASLVGFLTSSAAGAKRPLPLKAASAAALALRQWIRAALGPLPPQGDAAGSLQRRQGKAGGSLAEGGASERLKPLLRLLKRQEHFWGGGEEGGRAPAGTSGKLSSPRGGATQRTPTHRKSEDGEASSVEEEEAESEPEEVTPHTALQMLTAPVALSTRWKAEEETASRIQVLTRKHARVS
ncbi:hypothetical protein cyc_00224 [Cyclospora cayetanensis]|uniref:Uncharacterized protein n=1 Tax=Cyclospora cayetanensis TaxID=88456 RepID=A0A1D3CU89_9EIME|nr:hypothetical protein cyc_00224 [Cyclospora cayetanensis]